jgi:hypothetical protein
VSSRSRATTQTRATSGNPTVKAESHPRVASFRPAGSGPVRPYRARSERAGARWSFSAISIGPSPQNLPVGGALEHEAENIAVQAASASEPPLSPTNQAAPTSQGWLGSRDNGLVKINRAVPYEFAVPKTPPIVRDVLREPGEPLDAATRALLEPRFGYDFGQVRIHSGDRAAEAADAINARAYTVGSHIVFRRGAYESRSPGGLRLISHELAHVVQQADAHVPILPAMGSLTIVGRTRPTIQRDINFKGVVPKLGTYVLTAKPTATGLGAHEDVTITFSPHPDSPFAESIDFVQTAKAPGIDKPGDWAVGRPNEKLKSDSATTAGSGAHWTQQGGTLASVSLQHFGTADRASEILAASQGRLVWWLAQASDPGNDNLTRPLPAGVLLRIPGAIRGGAMIDINPEGVVPRSERNTPNVSPNYPDQGIMTPTREGIIMRVNGYHHRDGTLHDAQMIDGPGGGPVPGKFEFESAAFAKDIGLFYGAVRWWFSYSTSGITDEHAVLAPDVSDTFNAATASFNRTFKNRHIVRQGETLNSISIMYFGSTADAHRIYVINRTNPALTSDDPTKLIPGGTELDVGLGPSVWDSAQAGGSKK